MRGTAHGSARPEEAECCVCLTSLPLPRVPCKCSSHCTGDRGCLEAIADGGEQLDGAAGGALRASSSHAGAPPALSQELGMPLVYEGLTAHQVVLAQHHVALREKTGMSRSG